MFSQPKDILLSRVLICSYLHRAVVLLLVVMGSYYSTVSQCLSPEDLQRIETGLRAGSTSVVNEKLRKELIEMKKGVIDSMQTKTRQNDYSNRMTHGVFEEDTRVQTLEKTIAKKYDKSVAHFCEFLKKNGWFTQSLVGGDGAAAGFYLLKNFIPYEVQLDLIPAISIAISRNELNKNEDFASFLDRLRMRAGLKQLFGTQAFVKNDFLALAPIESERNVDARRAVYNMPPLADYMKFLEITYHMPLIRDHTLVPTLKLSVNAASANDANTKTVEMAGGDPEAVIRVDSSLVNLNVRVLENIGTNGLGGLEQKDFKVFEDGVQQDISFFAKTETPFDLVLLLDLSGSTTDKQGLIRKSTQRFIEVARPTDHVAIVTFTDKIRVITPLTSDRQVLLKSVNKIGDTGFSYVWDSLIYTLENMFPDKAADRRRAVVVMTDGVDNDLTFSARQIGSKASFGLLLETVRQNDAVIVPIYLDTEEREPYAINSGYNCGRNSKMYEYARKTLSIVAEESGGQMYSAQKAQDLDGVYEKVLNDLSEVYSLGYVPSNDKRDRGWRTVRVELRDRPGQRLKTKAGYYAR